MANIIGVKSLNLYVKSLLEDNHMLCDIAVEGEISSFVNHYKTGHYYFALKENDALIKTVMFSFNNKKINFVPENGMKVIVRGKVSLYEKDGTYQLYASDMFLSGVGARQIAFEKLKEKLQNEGLFDVIHKKQLPKYPFKIGIATSATGAALQDIISVAKRRFPCVEIVLANCTVQGDSAENSIVSAIQKLDEIADIELIIIARGGGSKDDLWVFNSENIARTAFNCTKPTISSIGHEIDFSILDFVCDVRAATPTAAAEIALPDISSLNMSLYNYSKNLDNNVRFKLDNYNYKLESLVNSKGFAIFKNNIVKNKDQIININNNLKSYINSRILTQKDKMDYFINVLEKQSPLNLLKNGYTLTYDENTKLLKNKIVNVGENIQVLTYKQILDCEVKNVRKRED